MEDHFFFKNSSGKELFGVIHSPEKPSTKGVLICHPLFEEKLHVHRVLVDFSRLLSSSGFVAMRFDYYGDGDSQGEFEQATLETRLDDISSALDFFRKRTSVDKLALLGVRFGATLASLSAEKKELADALILWAPILKGNEYLLQLLRMNLTGQVVVYKKVLYTREELIEGLREAKKINVEGYEITRELYGQVSKVDLLSEDKKFKGRTLLIQFSQDSDAFEPGLEKFRTLYSKNNTSELLKCADLLFWADMKYYPPSVNDLFGKTLNWIKANL